MSSVSVIGSGNMASAIGALAVKGGNAVESLGLRPRGLLSVGVGRHGAGNYNFSLGVNFG